MGLKNREKDILSTGEWLSDAHMEAVNKLLKEQYPQQNGLQDTLVLAELCRFKSSPTDFVQIVNISRSHWVCVSNVFLSPGVVEVFDSMPAYSTTSSGLKKQVAAILKTSEKSFDLYHVDVQRQVGGSDCGLSALAFAVSLCMRKDPHTERYAQTEMRQHLARCFEEKEMTFFQTPTEEGGLEGTELCIEKRLMSSVYAVSPGTSMMGNVDPWFNALDAGSGSYHQNCSNIDQDIVNQPSAKFTCNICLRLSH